MTTHTRTGNYRRLIRALQRIVGGIDHMGAVLVPKQSEADNETPDAITRPAVVAGMWMFVLVFGVFGLWAAIAPIKSAAVTSGQVVLDTNRKTIQHLEGGIIAEIFVREGQVVKEGDPLIRLDDTAAKARLDLFRSQSIAARTAAARLLAERDNKKKIDFPEDLLKERETNPVVAENLDSQRRLFKTRRKSTEGELSILRQKSGQYKEEIAGLESQKQSATDQIKLLNEEIDTVAELLKKGNAMRPRLLALQRNASALEGQRGEYASGISRAQQSIAETEIAMINLRNDFLNKVVAELKDTQTQIADLEERLRASADTVARIIIPAPISGQVTGLKVHTVGGVIAPGEKIMDIVPKDDKLIVEVMVKTEDIDVVRPDLEARVRLSAYRSRYVPLLNGKVTYVSGDRFVDERSGMPYYSARIEIDYGELEDLDNVKLYPGMPTEALIVTGSRSFLSYLIDPIALSFNHAFREE